MLSEFLFSAEDRTQHLAPSRQMLYTKQHSQPFQKFLYALNEMPCVKLLALCLALWGHLQSTKRAIQSQDSGGFGGRTHHIAESSHGT
jgi:hypothetical protein